MKSFFDKKGMLWVACSECERGGNGADNDTCKKFNGTGCFSGTLMGKYKIDPVSR